MSAPTSPTTGRRTRSPAPSSAIWAPPVGYPHPSFTEFPDGSTARFFQSPRSMEARELVADAALGVVDSVDLISPFNDDGAVFLYHRLLS